MSLNASAPVVGTVPVEVEPRQPNPGEMVHLLAREVLISSVWLVLLMSGCLLIFRGAVRLKSLVSPSSPLSRRDASPFGIDTQVPCIRCRYFVANAYLMCAVNPTAALRPEAKDCCDFQSKLADDKMD